MIVRNLCSDLHSACFQNLPTPVEGTYSCPVLPNPNPCVLPYLTNRRGYAVLNGLWSDAFLREIYLLRGKT